MIPKNYHGVKSYKHSNDYIRKELIDMKVVDESFQADDKQGMDEITYTIQNLKKEAMKYKGLNLVNMRLMRSRVMRTMKEERYN